MPTRHRFSFDGADWSAEADAASVHLSRNRQSPVAVQLRPHTRPDWATAVTPGGAASEGLAVRAGDRIWVQVEGHVFEVRAGLAPASGAREADALTPPMPATVTRVAVKVGDTVATGDLLVALEAMKMELPIRAPRDGVVRAVHCQPGDLVQPGTVLLDI